MPSTAPEQAAEPPGGQRAVTVRQPVEVVLEASHRVLGQQRHHLIADTGVLNLLSFLQCLDNHDQTHQHHSELGHRHHHIMVSIKSSAANRLIGDVV